MNAPALREANWGYLSGRVAVLEGRMVSVDALDRAALAAGASEATALEAAEALRARYASLIDEMSREAPDAAVFDLVRLPGRFGQMKAAFRRLLEESRGGLIPAGSAAAIDGGAPAAGEAAAAIEMLSGGFAEGERAHAGWIVDLAFDSARLLESLRLARSTGDGLVLAHVEAEVKTKVVLALWRAALWSGSEAGSPFGAPVARYFVRGELARGLAGRLLPLPLAEWGEVISEELTGPLGEAFGSGEAAAVEPWETSAHLWLAAKAGEFAHAPFGVARVYRFLWSLGVEERNLRLALVGRLLGVGAAARPLMWGQGA